MYHVTELIGKFDKTNHKKIISTLVDRKNHSFNSLKELAHFTREHTIFTSYQKEITGVPRTNDAGRELYLGNNLLWIDLDFTVNLVELRKKLLDLNLTCFAFYSSSYYNNSKANARACIICEKIIDIDNWEQIKFYANQILNKLKYSQIGEPDNSIYNLSSYLSFVKGDYQSRELFTLEGKPFKWITQEKFIKKYNSAPTEKEKKDRIQESGFGKLGDLIVSLNKLDSIETAIARSKGTISLSFTNIHEKTKIGYYINQENPWFVYHPKKGHQYLSKLLSPTDFEKFKELQLDQEILIKNNNRSLLFDKEVNSPFISLDMFKKGKLLFIESPTGTGKTTYLAEWLSTQTNKSVLFISVNRMQAIATANSLSEKLNFICYLKHSLKQYHDEKKGRKLVDIYNLDFQKNIEENKFPERLICGVISLHHLANEFGELKKKYDYVIIDEISTLPGSISNNIPLIFERLETFELGLRTLKKVLSNAERVICMDGFVSNSVVNLMATLSNKEPYLIRNNIPTNKVVEIYTCSSGQPKFEGKGTSKKFLDKITCDIESANFQKTGRLMVVALSSLDLSIKLKEHLTRNFPDKKVEIFNSEVTEKYAEKVIRIFENLDLYLKQENIDILIYSPTISTGIDIPQAKDTNVYQIISGDHLLSHTNYQMTMRGRKAKSYKVLISKSLMIDKKISTFKDYIDESIDSIKDSLPFKSKRPMRFKARWFQTSGLLLAYKELEYNISREKWEKIKTLKSLLEGIKELDSYEGVKLGLRIDKAFIDFQNELFTLGKNGYQQFLSFLNHEKCRISIEEDIDYKSPNHYGKYAVDSKKYIESHIEDYSKQLKELNCWKEEHSKLKHTRLFEILKIAKVCYSLKEEILEVTDKNVLSNNDLIEIYEYFYRQSFFPNRKFLKKYFNYTEVNRSKILTVKNILSVLFNVEKLREKIRIIDYSKYHY